MNDLSTTHPRDIAAIEERARQMRSEVIASATRALFRRLAALFGGRNAGARDVPGGRTT